MSALTDALNAKLGITANSVDETEVAQIVAIIDAFRPLMVGVAERHETAVTTDILKAAKAGFPRLLAAIEADPMAARAFLHAQSIGDPTVDLPGIQPAQQAAPVTPVAALGSGTATTAAPAADQDPLVAEFAALLASNRTAAVSTLELIRDVVSLQSSNAALSNLLSTALLRMVAAATKPDADLTTEERAWTLANDHGEPVLKGVRDSRNALTRVTGERDTLRAFATEMATRDDALNAAEDMAGRIAAGTADTVPAAHGTSLQGVIRHIRAEIARVNTPVVQPRPRRAQANP